MAEEESKSYRKGPYSRAAEFLLGRELSFYTTLGEWGTTITAGKQNPIGICQAAFTGKLGFERFPCTHPELSLKLLEE